MNDDDFDQNLKRIRDSFEKLGRMKMTRDVLREWKLDVAQLKSLTTGSVIDRQELVKNLVQTEVRRFLSMISSVDRRDEELCIAVNQTIWFEVLPYVVNAMTEDPKVVEPYEAMRRSVDALRTEVFSLSNEKSLRRALR